MSPPSVIAGIVRPAVIFVESEIILVRAVLRDESAFFVALFILIYSFSVEPFVKRTAVVEYTVEDYFHSSLVCFFYNLCKKLVACFKVLFVGYTVDISGGETVFFLTVF